MSTGCHPRTPIMRLSTGAPAAFAVIHSVVERRRRGGTATWRRAGTSSPRRRLPAVPRSRDRRPTGVIGQALPRMRLTVVPHTGH